MGVPKFFRYISERYPCLSEVIKEYQIPEFDNLYLDMNGIIHVCSHPNDADPHFRITEEQIFKDVFHYIEILFRMIQPKKLFFMAVDGVAPRAKMNQQRGRRFRSAKEAVALEKKAIARGEILPEEKRFDSNCITPGTVFMVRLQEQLKYFVSYKISTDKIWQIPKIILSGHETPGEGEHKIMDYIRYLRSQRGWSPNTRHCLYGLDADLIMLGMCTHEPHFSLLREEVKFGRGNQKRVSTPEETTFYLLHLSLLRDYLDLEFKSLESILPFPYDLERIIDDWVLMGFLVGNDFIPNLPGLNIADGALQLLYKIYIEVLPKLGGYLNDGGTLNLERFEAYLERLAQFDIDQFRETHADLKYFESKTGRKLLHSDSLSFDMDTANDDLKSLIESTKSALENGAEDSGDESDVDTNSDDDLMAEFSLFKRDYYMNKLDYGQVTMEVLTSQAEGYVRAIQWNLHYYYHGCPSWSWFYPHHYSPYISDIKGFSNLKLEFDLGRPFLPFQQLLAVLPAASKQFLPEPLQKLMDSEDSPLVDYYPKDFQIDMNGKKQEWEGVVLIPFIDQDSLLSAMEPCYEQMTDEEKRRNSHGPMHIYQFTLEDLGSYEAPEFFPKVASNHAKCREVWAAELCVDRKDLVKGLYPGVSESYMLGFPTLKHVPFTASLQKNKVKVFENQSRGENMMIQIRKENPKDLDSVAQHMLGKTVLVNWPHLLQAKVSSISTLKVCYSVDRNNEIVTSPMCGSDISAWNLTRAGIVARHRSRMGIELGEFEVLVWAHPLQGTKLKFDPESMATISMVWCKEAVAYPFQTSLVDVAMYKTVEPLPRHLSEVFPVGSTCFMLMGPRYGSQGTVMEGSREGRVKVSIVIHSDPDFGSLPTVLKRAKKQYFVGGVCGQRVGIGAHLFSRITGTIFIQSAHTEADKVNIGLNLKFNKKNEELMGFTRKEGIQWYYSEDAVDLVRRYVERFPDLFEYLSKNTGDDIFFKDDIYPDNGSEKVREILGWLKLQPHCSAERRSVGAESLEEEGVKEIERIVKEFKPRKTRRLIIHVAPYLLYQPKTYLGQIEPDTESEHLLLDRVVNVRECHSIPLGLKGTIVGIDKKENRDGTLYDIVFDEAFVGGLKLGTEEGRCYRLTRQAFINISYGVRTKRATFEVVPSLLDLPVGSETMDANRNTSAFANWRNKNMSSQHGIPHVTDFFPSYQNQQQTRREVSGHQQQIPKPTADSEFQAMWNVLQSQKLDTTKSPQPSSQREAPFPLMSVSQQTDALKKFLRLDNGTLPNVRPEIPTKAKSPSKACGHVQCCSTLMNMCQKMGIPYPTYSYAPNLAASEVTCTIRFPGIVREVVGLPEKEKIQAAKSAACMGIQMLEQGVIHSSVFSLAQQQQQQPQQQQQQVGRGFYQQPPPPGFHQTTRGQSHMNQNLPTPPQQWYQQNNKNAIDGSQQKWSQRDDHQTKHVNGGRSGSGGGGGGGGGGGVSQFLPLQVQKGSSRLATPRSGKMDSSPALHTPPEAVGEDSAAAAAGVTGAAATAAAGAGGQEDEGTAAARGGGGGGRRGGGTASGGSPPSLPSPRGRSSRNSSSSEAAAAGQRKPRLKPRLAAKFPVPLVEN